MTYTLSDQFHPPFMFANNKGEILKVQAVPLVSVQGLDLLIEEAQKTPVQSDLLTMLQTFKSALSHHPVQNIWGPCRINDLAPDDRKKYLAGQASVGISSSQEAYGYKHMYVAIVPGGFAKARRSDHIWQITPFTAHPKTWGWLDKSVEEMLPALSKFARQHSVTLSSRTIKNVFKFKEMLDKKELQIEYLDAEHKWARSTSLALFNPHQGGYVSNQQTCTDLAGARLFASKSVLDTWVKKNHYNSELKHCVVVEVQSRVVSYDPALLAGKHAAEFKEGIAILEKEDLEEAINKIRLQNIEEPQTSPKKKM